MSPGTEHLSFEPSEPDNVMSLVDLQTASNWLRMLFCISSAVVQLQRVTQNAHRRSSPLLVSVA